MIFLIILLFAILYRIYLKKVGYNVNTSNLIGFTDIVIFMMIIFSIIVLIFSITFHPDINTDLVNKVLNKEVGQHITINVDDESISISNGKLKKHLNGDISINNLGEAHHNNISRLNSNCESIEISNKFSYFNFMYLFINESDYCTEDIKKLYKEK